LFKVWRDYRDTPWPALLAFWGVPTGHQSIRSRGEVLPRGRRAEGPRHPDNC
jgi:hypothetical protein